MWEPFSLDLAGRFHVDSVDPRLAIACGLLLVAFGRKIYWLAAGLAGFVVGYYLFLRFVDPEPGLAPLVLGAVVGVLAAAVVVVFQKLAVAAAGFVAAGLATVHLAVNLQWEAGYWVLVAALAAGIAGAFVARSLFELALVVLTSVAGAALVTMALTFGARVEMLLLAGLTAAGIVFQLAIGRRRKTKD